MWRHGDHGRHGIELTDLSRVVSVALTIVACGLIPWIIYLAIKLPPRFDAHRWTLLWVGFDVVLVCVLAYTAWAAWFRRQIMVLTTVALGTLLTADAWFDVMTSPWRRGGLVSILLALVAELPLAAFCFWLARSIMLHSIADMYESLSTGDPPTRLRDAELFSLTVRAQGASGGASAHRGVG